MKHQIKDIIRVCECNEIWLIGNKDYALKLGSEERSAITKYIEHDSIRGDEKIDFDMELIKEYFAAHGHIDVLE